MKLTLADRAIIDPEKLRDYLLSDSHPIGRFKAAFFKSLGFTRDGWRELDRAIRALIAVSEASLVDDTQYGRKYVVTGTLKGTAGRSGRVTTVWIVARGEEMPRFVTAYPEEER